MARITQRNGRRTSPSAPDRTGPHAGCQRERIVELEPRPAIDNDRVSSLEPAGRADIVAHIRANVALSGHPEPAD